MADEILPEASATPRPAPKCIGCRTAASVASDRVHCSVHRHQPPEIVTWDHRDQPDMAHLDELVRQLSHGTVRISQVPTGDDSYAVIVADRVIAPEEAEAIYVASFYGGLDD